MIEHRNFRFFYDVTKLALPAKFDITAYDIMPSLEIQNSQTCREKSVTM
jgi:hypothetical protein